MAGLAARDWVPVVLMHMQGTPRTMQQAPRYRDVVQEVKSFLAARADFALRAGIDPERIIIDPGIGFGKSLDHNLSLLRGLADLAALPYPLLVGPSRKTFLGTLLQAQPRDRLEGTLAAVVAAALGGASMVRVHDVRETVRALGVADALHFGVDETQEKSQ
jgi:dihydropteroate synthase